MYFMKLPIPTSLVDQSHLTRFHMETMGCFTNRTPLSMEISHGILSAFSACSIEVKKVSDKQQGMLARVLAVTHIQTLKVRNSYPNLLSISVNCNILKLEKVF